MPNAYRLHSAGNVFLYLPFCISRRSSHRHVKTYVYEFSRDISPTRGHFPWKPGSFPLGDKILRNGYSFSEPVSSSDSLFLMPLDWRPTFQILELCASMTSHKRAVRVPHTLLIFTEFDLSRKRYLSHCVKDEGISQEGSYKTYAVRKYINFSVKMTMRYTPVILTHTIIVLCLSLFLSLYKHRKKEYS